jgi:MFS family permease
MPTREGREPPAGALVRPASEVEGYAGRPPAAASVPAAVPYAPPPGALPAARPPAWRWVHVGVAALAMVLTLPGRTHGLGLFTEPLLKSLRLDRESYGFLNLWATLFGAVFCLPCGRLLDRLGTRAVFLGVTVALGAVVLAMSWCVTGDSPWPLALDLPDWLGGPVVFIVMADLFLFLLLTRGLGQSALSVVSLALIGRSAGRKPGLPMGVYAAATTAGFLAAFAVLGAVVKAAPDAWREPWAGVGVGVLVLGVVGGLMVRNGALEADPAKTAAAGLAGDSHTLGQALLSPAFWTFSVTTSFYGLVVAGTSLFGESLLAERGFDKAVFVNVTLLGIPVGLAANLLAGWLATRWPLPRVMALSAVLLAAALAAFPFVNTELQVYAYAAALAAAGGAITVCFFSVYRRAFGPARLGSIQGVAQMLTVLFSAVGPLIFAKAKARLGGYTPLFPAFAAAAAALAVFTWLAPLPRRRAADTSPLSDLQGES